MLGQFGMVSEVRDLYSFEIQVKAPIWRIRKRLTLAPLVGVSKKGLTYQFSPGFFWFHENKIRLCTTTYFVDILQLHKYSKHRVFNLCYFLHGVFLSTPGHFIWVNSIYFIYTTFYWQCITFYGCYISVMQHFTCQLWCKVMMLPAH